jgi:[acyl-carrier-protein] S-malonyltransferase
MGLAFIFPGQGDYLPGTLDRLCRRSERAAAEVAEVRDAVLTEAGVDIAAFFGDDTPSIQELVRSQPEVSQLLLFVSGLAAARAAEEELGAPGLIVGHSLGELVALCAAGCLSVTDGARAVACRTRRVAEALVGLDTGLLAVLGDRARSEALVGSLADEALSLAGVNGSSQIVVAGPVSALESYERLAAVLGLRCARVASPWSFHTPLLTGAAVRLTADLSDLRINPAPTPVYSPILGRFYRSGESAARPLASHLVRPFRLDLALASLAARGHGHLVDLGSRGLLQASLREVAAEWKGVTVSEPVGGAPKGATPSLGPARPRGDAPTVPTPVAARTPVATALPVLDRAVLDRAVLVAELVAMYAAALEYPPEVFDEEVELEADLGVDSVKQTELLARVSERYRLPAPDAEFRVGDHPTLARVADLVLGGRAVGAAPPVAPTPMTVVAAAPPPPPDAAVSRLDRASLLADLVTMYATALEYPPEVFEEGVDLEADLGVDSVKQTELLARVSAQYQLPAPDANFRVGDYPTLATVADLVLRGASGARPAPPGLLDRAVA